jgi:hypothetical protein
MFEKGEAPFPRESTSEHVSSIEAFERHGLKEGQYAIFKKVQAFRQSLIPPGSIVQGFLDKDVKLGQAITFNGHSSTISRLEGFREESGILNVRTTTSEYELLDANKNPDSIEDVLFVVTARGSIYKYLNDGRTQRYKYATGETHEPQNLLVYVPDFSLVKAHAPQGLQGKLGEDDFSYEQILLDYVHSEKTYVVNGQGRRIENLADALKESRLYFALINKQTGEAYAHISVSLVPKIGYSTYDTRKWEEKPGEWRREVHLGNKVIKIVTKD